MRSIKVTRLLKRCLFFKTLGRIKVKCVDPYVNLPYGVILKANSRISENVQQVYIVIIDFEVDTLPQNQLRRR